MHKTYRRFRLDDTLRESKWDRRIDLLSQGLCPQYQWRCRVSRPGSGWSSVGPLRSIHAEVSLNLVSYQWWCTDRQFR